MKFVDTLKINVSDVSVIFILKGGNFLGFFPRQVERFWGASGDFWQGCWKKVHALFGGDEFLLSVVGRFYYVQ